MRPRARDKKLLEEWVVPLANLEDVHEVHFSLQNACCLSKDNLAKYMVMYESFISFVQKFKKFCLGKLRSSPWSELDGLQPETRIINDQLGRINSKGFLTINSQPAVNAERSDSPIVGK